MADFRLHCFAQSGNAYKAALMLELCGAAWEPVFVDFMAGETRGADFRTLNPMGEVPVLEHGDLVLTQSGVMLDYLAAELGRFGPRNEEERREVLRWTLWDNHRLTGMLATWRFIANFLAPEKRSSDVVAFLEARARSALAVLDTHLEVSDWVVGAAPTTADISCCGYLFYAEEYPINWEGEYPHLTGWRNRVAELEGWRHPYDMMPGHPLPAREA
ncbi:MAG TPA: glutathione S-transferase [Thermohalobaculum sp.]|nr:glutathione S-transferase [Thermohalobaculum sp.]